MITYTFPSIWQDANYYDAEPPPTPSFIITEVGNNPIITEDGNNIIEE
jgi:hypothetical protein